nr:hypothetical protein [Tanacetum cinerariifolium]
MPKVLLLAWDRVFKIKDAFGNEQYKPEDIQELFRKLLDDLQNIHEALAEYINSLGWNRPAIYDDDDDDDLDYASAITPVLSTEEPDNSLSMGDEHLDIISATKSDEVIKSNVEDLVPIPSKSEGIPDTMCDVHLVNNPTPLEAKDYFEIVINSNVDYSSSDDDSLYNENIEYVEASPHDSELVSLEVAEIVIPEDEEIEDDNLREKLLNVNLLIAKIEALKDNPTPSFEFLTKSSSTSPKSFLKKTNTFDKSLPEFENFCFDLEEISSGSTTTHSDISLSDYEDFYFYDHIKEISSGSTTTHSDISLSEYDSFIFDLSNDQFRPSDRSDFTHEEFADELAHIISPPEYDCFYFKNLPDPGEWISILNSEISENLSFTTRVNLPVEDDHSPLLAYVVWIFLAYLISSRKAVVTKDPDSEKSTSFTSMVGSPGSIYHPGWGVTNNCLLDTPAAFQDMVDHIVPQGYFSELCHLPNDEFLNQYNTTLARQVAIGSQLREKHIRNLKALLEAEVDMKGAEEAKNALLEAEVDMKGAEEAKNAQIMSEERIKSTFEEFKKYKDDRVSSRCAKMDARLDALSIDFDEELYPHMLTAITGRRWVIGYGLHLAIMKYVIMESLFLENDYEEYTPQWICELRPNSSQLKIPVYPKVRNLKDPWSFKDEILLEDTIAANVSRAKKKKKCHVVYHTHGVDSAYHASNNQLSQQVSTLQAQIMGEERIKAAFKEIKKYEDDRVSSRCAEMDARLDALSIYFDKELYPHTLMAIADCRWIIGHGLRLAVMKCAESTELRKVFANVVYAGIVKGMSEGLKHEVEHGKAKVDLAAIEAYDPEADTKYVAALHALKDLKYPLVDQLEKLKDAPIVMIMASLFLES